MFIGEDSDRRLTKIESRDVTFLGDQFAKKDDMDKVLIYMRWMNKERLVQVNKWLVLKKLYLTLFLIKRAQRICFNHLN